MAYCPCMLARPHLSIAAQRRRLMTKPDPSLLQDVVAPKVIDAMRAASRALSQAGVRHSVAGGLSVGANGYPRATKDVHFRGLDAKNEAVLVVHLDGGRSEI